MRQKHKYIGENIVPFDIDGKSGEIEGRIKINGLKAGDRLFSIYVENQNEEHSFREGVKLLNQTIDKARDMLKRKGGAFDNQDVYSLAALMAYAEVINANLESEAKIDKATNVLKDIGNQIEDLLHK